MRDKLGFIFCIAMLGAAIPSVLFYYAAPHVPAGVLSITVALIPSDDLRVFCTAKA